MKTWTLKKRFVGFGLLLLALVMGLMLGSYLVERSLQAGYERYVARVDTVRFTYMSDMMHEAIRSDVLSYMGAAYTEYSGGAQAAQASLKRHAASMRNSLKQAMNADLAPEAKAALAKANRDATAYFKAAEKVMAGQSLDAGLAEAELPDFNKAYKVLGKSLSVSRALIKSSSEALQHANEQTAQQARIVVLFLAAGGCTLLLLLSYLLAHSVLKPLGGEAAYATEIVSRIAQGDLGEDIVTKTGDTRSLLAAMKAMQDELTRIVYGIREAVDTMGDASGQIASGNSNLSQRTEEQASSLEEAASSMEELTGTVKQNAENARMANQLAVSASEVAVKGGTVVGEVVGTMDAINESSKKVVDIIGVIDGIAFQTNILALNAAVEAARAGQQGRGFAVVASEVRSLAQRSAAAAKEIKALIGDSVDKVGAGTKLVDEAGRTMEEIVASVKRVTDIMNEITAASEEQSSGIEQVSQTLTQMDQVTQENAALVEQAAVAAESMREQARNLSEAVAAFKLRGAAEHSLEAQQQEAAKTEDQVAWPARERRGPNRASNVARLPQKRSRAKPEPTTPRAKVALAASDDGQWNAY